ncbi:hypothetical protein Dimus_013578, partial [Dionaea muscipula]
KHGSELSLVSAAPPPGGNLLAVVAVLGLSAASPRGWLWSVDAATLCDNFAHVESRP